VETGKGKTAGGCTNNPTWINNPQYILDLTGPGTVAVTLSQTGINGKPTHIGLYGWKSTNGYRILASGNPVVTTTIIDSPQISANFEGPGKFVVMPSTFSPAQETTFELKAVTTSASITPVKEWVVCSSQGEWRTGQCGGCCNSITWKENPQIPLNAPAQVNLTIVLSTADDSKKPMGFYVFNPQLTNRVFASKFVNTNSVSDTVSALPAGQYVVIPTTFNPNIMGKFVVSTYTDGNVTLG